MRLTTKIDNFKQSKNSNVWIFARKLDKYHILFWVFGQKSEFLHQNSNLSYIFWSKIQENPKNFDTKIHKSKFF